MTKSKQTKSALFSSVVALLLCFTMLLGTTFAWFTDTASSSVNTIQAGTLDIQLLDANGESLEGKTLAWQKATGDESEAVLWEPGCTYNLQTITIKNNGNLALKYKIEITGIQGSAKLNKAIDWTINNSNSVSDLGADHSLAADASDTLTISGKMKTTAGNEYQGLSIDGVAITVLATQDTVEYDSTNNQYDVGASTNDVKIEKTVKIDSTTGSTEVLTADAGEAITVNGNGGTLTVNDAAIDTNGGDLNVTNLNVVAGTASDYAVRISGGNANLTTVDVQSAGGGVGVSNGAKVSFTGDVDVSTTSTAGRYNFYVVGEGSELTINDGKYSFSKTLNQKRAYIYVGDGATVYVKGGTFGAASTRSGYTAGIMGDGKVIITGGTFGFNPTQWVAEDYVATGSNGVWTVTAR